MAMQDKDRREYHPAVSIFSWLLFALAVELAAPSRLVWITLAVSFLLLKNNARTRFARLVWKAKWLLLALLVFYAWTIPGTLLFSSEYSPTLEGLNAGVFRIFRLVLLIGALARLLSEFSSQQLAAGIYILAMPLARLGLDARALAVRLVLALEEVERRPPSGKWMDKLEFPAPHENGAGEIRLLLPSVGLSDGLTLMGACVLLGVALS